MNRIFSFRIVLLQLLIFFLVSNFLTEVLQAQEQKINLSTYNYFFGALNETPFWHHANRDGTIQSRSTISNLSGFSMEIPFLNVTPGLDIHFETEAVNRFSDLKNSLHLPQLYGQADHGVLRLRAGRFYETMGMNEPDLGTGSMILSRNATPFPKISLGTNRFLDLPFTNGRFQFFARFSEGILERERFTRSPRVHQKSFYLKLGIGDFEGVGGIMHSVMWGGENPVYGNMSLSMNEYLRIVFSLSAPADGDLPGRGNRLGNTVGAYDFAASYSLENYRIQAYRLFYLEDTPATRFRSPWDGLWGAGIERKDGNGLVNSFIYEHLNTIAQDAKDHIPAGRANYYNHLVYRTGWTYYGSTLGNPLLSFDREANRFVNNMVLAHHIGITGLLSERLNYRLLLTYNRNYGICDDRISPGRCSSITTQNPIPEDWKLLSRSEFRQDRYSTLIEGQYLISSTHRLSIIGSLAIDYGEYSAPRFGLMLGISWNNQNPHRRVLK